MSWYPLFRFYQYQGTSNIKDSSICMQFKKMRPTWRNITHFINVIFFALFLSHLSIICYQSLNPNVPSIRVFKEDLQKIDFPISFKICVKELENITARYEKVGYPHNYYFYLGISKFNQAGGWYGHTEDNKTFGSLEGEMCICNCTHLHLRYEPKSFSRSS